MLMLTNTKRTGKVIIKKVVVIGATMIVLLAADWALADVCEIVNGSFEDDGWISDITVEEPNGWDVNVLADKFEGYVYMDWVTHGTYSLTLHSKRRTFAAGDMATVSQEVYLTDVNEIIFDLKLETDLSEWDPNDPTCAAVLLIDDYPVWESNDLEPNESGEYPNRTYTVEEEYRDAALHKLSLGIRIKVDVTETLWNRYYTYWDFIEFNLHCGGFGFLSEDINRDCYVDMNDLQMLAEVWLDAVDANDKCDLFQGDVYPYGIINFPDFAVFADIWDGNVPDLETFVEVWLNEVDRDHEWNLFHEDKGIINFRDFGVLADKWLASSYE